MDVRTGDAGFVTVHMGQVGSEEALVSLNGAVITEGRLQVRCQRTSSSTRRTSIPPRSLAMTSNPCSMAAIRPWILTTARSIPTPGCTRSPPMHRVADPTAPSRGRADASRHAAHRIGHTHTLGGGEHQHPETLNDHSDLDPNMKPDQKTVRTWNPQCLKQNALFPARPRILRSKASTTLPGLATIGT